MLSVHKSFLLHMKFVLSGGGTLGPVTPLLAIAEELKRHGDHTFIWIGTASGPEKTLVEKTGLPFIAIPAGRLRRYISFRNLAAPFLLAAGCFRAWHILRRIRPDRVLTAGAFVAVPVAWAAWFLKIPVLLHQQDITWGLANKLMLPVAKWVTVNFPISLRTAPRRAHRRMVLTGNPVRAFIRESFDAVVPNEILLHKFHLEPDIPVVLVLGGGTGALSLNELVATAAQTLTNHVQILHVTGKGKAVPTETLAHPERYHHYEFLTSEMRDALHLATVVVSRAGLATISELALLAKPTMLIPIPDSHQEQNADYLVKEGAIVRVGQKGLTAQTLAKVILDFANDHERQSGVSTRLRKMANPDAAKEIAELVLKK